VTSFGVLVDPGDLPDQIERLEVDIEQLAETIESPRKAMLLSQGGHRRRRDLDISLFPPANQI
jgi:hypothetical protein